MDFPTGATDAMAIAPPAPKPILPRVLADLGAFAGGFGLVIVSWLSAEPISIVVLLLVGGAIFRGHVLGAWLGCVSAAVALLILFSMLTRSPPHEYSGLDQGIYTIGVFVFAFLAAVGLMAYELASVVGGGEWFAPRGLVSRIGAVIAAVVGVVAIVATVVTWVGLIDRPGLQSYELSLPAGWTIVDRVGYRDPALGETLTGVYGTDESPTSGESPEHPVVGVSVTRAAASPTECLGAFQGWPGVDSILYDSALLDHGLVSLPAGPAYREVRAPEPSGTVVYGYGLHRIRSIGFIREQLCYAVVVTLPPDSPVSRRAAEAIVRSFRFR